MSTTHLTAYVRVISVDGLKTVVKQYLEEATDKFLKDPNPPQEPLVVDFNIVNNILTETKRAAFMVEEWFGRGKTVLALTLYHKSRLTRNFYASVIECRMFVNKLLQGDRRKLIDLLNQKLNVRSVQGGSVLLFLLVALMPRLVSELRDKAQLYVKAWNGCIHGILYSTITDSVEKSIFNIMCDEISRRGGILNADVLIATIYRAYEERVLRLPLIVALDELEQIATQPEFVGDVILLLVRLRELLDIFNMLPLRLVLVSARTGERRLEEIINTITSRPDYRHVAAIIWPQKAPLEEPVIWPKAEILLEYANRAFKRLLNIEIKSNKTLEKILREYCRTLETIGNSRVVFSWLRELIAELVWKYVVQVLRVDEGEILKQIEEAGIERLPEILTKYVNESSEAKLEDLVKDIKDPKELIRRHLPCEVVYDIVRGSYYAKRKDYITMWYNALERFVNGYLVDPQLREYTSIISKQVNLIACQCYVKGKRTLVWLCLGDVTSQILERFKREVLSKLVTKERPAKASIKAEEKAAQSTEISKILLLAPDSKIEAVDKLRAEGVKPYRLEKQHLLALASLVEARAMDAEVAHHVLQELSGEIRNLV